MAIEVNEFQTQLTDELLDSLDREVRDTLIEYISNVPFIQNLISPNRERAKDRPRDSQGRIIVDLVKPHILEDMDYFRPALMHFREHGVYTKLKPNSNKNSEFYRFLKQEVHRCRYGMVRPSDGEWVTGHLYFYLNYMPITVVRLDASKTFGTRLDDFPDMWEGIYWRYHYIEQARYGGLYNDFKGGQHGAEIACRGASKAHPYDEFAYTPNGIKRWGDIEVGDVLFGDDGKPTTVIDIPFDGEAIVYKLTLSDGRYVEASIDHEWVVCKDNDINHINLSTYDLSLGLQNKEHSYYIKNSPCSVEEFGDKSEIINVVEIGEKKCKCVTVDNESGCYLINEYIPTHNSYSVAAILAKLFLLGENDLNKSKVKANMFSYLKEYLNKDGTLDKFVNAINHCGDHTEFPSLRLKDSMSEMQWKSGFMDSENRPRGSQNEVLGLAIKDDPGKARGKRPHPYSEKVITYSGIKKWGDIKIGDTLIGDDGKPTNVIQIHEVGEQDIYKIELSDGRTVHSTLDHLWQVDILNEKVDRTTEELIDLIKSNYVYIRSCSPIESLHEKDVDVVKFIDSGGNILELSICQRFQYFKIKYDDLVYHNYLWINDLDKKEVEIVSRIARSLGWGCYSGSHSVRIDKCPSKSRIINIELVGREQAKCVTVDNDSHLYLIGDFVITHNSSFQAVEEFGFFPNYLDFYQTTLPNVQEGQAAAGQSYSIGCVCAGTKVYKHDGELINIEDLSKKDGICGYDGTGLIKEDVTYIQDEAYKDCFRIETEHNRFIECSYDHPLLVIDNPRAKKSKQKAVFKEAKYIVAGDRLLALNTSSDKKERLYDDLLFDSSSKISSNYLKDKELLNNLESIKVKRCDPIGNKRIYNLTTSKTHTYVTNGFISHNTGGEENSDFTGALELIQSPSGYNIYGLPNFYDKGSNGSRKTIFFFPGYINRIGYYNKDGVSDVIGAMLSEIKYRVNLKYNSSDPMMLTRRKAETAFTLQDAIMRRTGSIFPSAELNDRINELDANPSSYNDMYVGYLSIEDGEVKFKPDSDLQPIMEFPHKDNKKEGAVHILRMPEKDSSGKVPNGRYIAGSDVYDDDTSETLSLGSFYILDLFTDDLVLEYTGRPMFADDFYEICRRACLFYNAELNYENNKKGLFKYFSQHNSLYLLSDTLEFLADKEIIKPGTYGNKKKGVGNYGQVAPYGRRCIRDYLLKPVEMERQIEKADGSVEVEEVNIMKLHTIKYRALLQELSMWSEDLNTDRVDALAMLMLLREDRLRLAGDDGVKKSIRKDDATYLGNDDFFNRNYKNKHN